MAFPGKPWQHINPTLPTPLASGQLQYHLPQKLRAMNNCSNLVRVFKGNIEVKLSQDEQLTLHHAVPQVPEFLVTF